MKVWKMMFGVLFAVICLAVISVDSHAAKPPPPGPATYYVDCARADSNKENGSASRPFNTIQEGIDAAQPGDTVEVASGICVLDTVIDTANYGYGSSVTSALLLKSNVTVRGDADGGTILEETITEVIDFLVLAMYRGNSYDIESYEPVEGVVFENFTIRNIDPAGLIEGHVLKLYNPADGARWAQTANRIVNITVLGPYGDVVDSIAMNAAYTPTEFVDNTIRGVGRGIEAVGVDRPDTGSFTGPGYTISYNEITDVHDGLYVTGYVFNDPYKVFQVYNNIVDCRGLQGSIISAGLYLGSAKADVMNNTFAACGTGIDTNLLYSYYVMNNILTGNDTGIADLPYSQDTAFNLYWQNGTDRTVSGGQGIPIDGANGEIAGDPQLDASLRITSGLSPAVDAGKTGFAYPYCDDIDGDPRCTGDGGDGMYDIGADEYAGQASAIRVHDVAFARLDATVGTERLKPFVLITDLDSTSTSGVTVSGRLILPDAIEIPLQATTDGSGVAEFTTHFSAAGSPLAVGTYTFIVDGVDSPLYDAQQNLENSDTYVK